MSVTTREVPYEVAKEGGFPSAEEFEGVWKALSDVREFGLTPLFHRIASPLVDIYEGEGDDRRVSFTYADLGLLVSKADALIEWAEYALREAKALKEIARDIGEILDIGGVMEHAPRFGKHGGEYTPSRAALERWGLVEAKVDA